MQTAGGRGRCRDSEGIVDVVAATSHHDRATRQAGDHSGALFTSAKYLPGRSASSGGIAGVATPRANVLTSACRASTSVAPKC
jgi:hypothetical protein